MINLFEIKSEMPVVCLKDGQFAIVDHVEGADYIKLKKDEVGNHHYIPVSWVTSIEHNKVKIDSPGDDAIKNWLTSLPPR
jgi:hypothetical protein